MLSSRTGRWSAKSGEARLQHSNVEFVFAAPRSRLRRHADHYSNMEYVVKKDRNQKVPEDHRRRVKSLCTRYGVSPLEHMLKVMNDEAVPVELRSDMAKTAAPYVHRKLMPIEGFNPSARDVIDITKLDDEELSALERLIAKSQITIPDADDDDDDDFPM